MLCQILLSTEAIIFCGHMSKEALAGCTLANLVSLYIRMHTDT